MNPKDSFVVGRIGGGDAVLDRHRQHEAVVVVGVLADQVDPTGGEDHPDRRSSELAPELVAGRGRGVSGGGRGHRSRDGS
jgi:hypothetical protein